MSIIGTWTSHVVPDNLLLGHGELFSKLEIVDVIGDKVSGTYNGSPISGTFDGRILDFVVSATGLAYHGRIFSDSIVFPPGHRGRGRGPKTDGDDGTWTAEKTGGSGGDTDRKKKKKSGAASRKRTAAPKKR